MRTHVPQRERLARNIATQDERNVEKHRAHELTSGHLFCCAKPDTRIPTGTSPPESAEFRLEAEFSPAIINCFDRSTLGIAAPPS